MRRLFQFARRTRREIAADVDEELRFHIDERASAIVARGVSSAKAREQALSEFGDMDDARRYLRSVDSDIERSQRRKDYMGDFLQDVTYALRKLRATPVFTCTAILTLALGIGANTTILSLVDAVVLRPLPGVAKPQELVELSFTHPYPRYLDFAAQVPALTLAASREREMALGTGDQTQHITGAIITGDFFQVLGVHTALGRGIGAQDDTPASPAVAVLSDALWRSSFGADPHVLGRVITLNSAPVTIIGVAAREFRGTHLGAPSSLWVPIHTWPLIKPPRYVGLEIENRTWGWLTLVGRLSPGATVQQAASQIAASIVTQQRLYPNETPNALKVTLSPAAISVIGADARGPVIRFMEVLTTVVALVLLIACANIANLLLARAAQRRKEIAVRIALGAARARVVRQLVTESLVLATGAGAAGVGLMLLAARGMSHLTILGPVASAALQIGPDTHALIIAGTVTLMTALLFGLVPALQASRPDIVQALRQGERGSSGRWTMRGSLISLQVALSLVLLIGAGLFARGLAHALTLNPGFKTEGIAIVSVDPGLAQYDSTRAIAFFQTVATRASALPTARDVSWTVHVPLTGASDDETATIEGYTPKPGEVLDFEVNAVGAHFHRTMGIPIVTGREFDERDAHGAPPVTIINETLARTYFAGRDPIGRHISFTGVKGDLTIVGIAHDIKYHSLQEAPMPYAYFPLAQVATSNFISQSSLIVHTSGDPEALLSGLRTIVHDAGPGVPVLSYGTFGDDVNQLLAPQRIGVVLLGLFGALALLVSSVGLYGVVAYAVSQRTRDIGIRIALGAPTHDVIRAVVGDHLRDLIIGLVIGLSLAAMATRAMAAFLYGVSATDALTFGAAAGAMIVVGVVASYLPARKATRVDPLIALRAE